MKIKRILALLLTGVTIVSSVACSRTEKGKKENGVTSEITSADADIWSVPATVKVLSTAEPKNYADMKADTISLVSGKNEYESGQIIVSAKKDLSFTVELSDLVNKEHSDSVISSENFNVYIQKYINVAKNWNGNGSPVGSYPDAILPQENAVAYEQNKVKEGDNGGAWLEFFVPESTVAGTYEGTATVNIGDTALAMPVSLEVYDVTIPTECSQKSLFTVNRTYVTYQELDNSQEIVDKYYDMLLRYRCAPTSVSGDDTAPEEFAERAYAYCQKGMSTVGLSSGGGTLDLDGFSVLDYERLTENIVALAKKSLETGYDMIEKAVYYNWWIDEPFFVTYEDGKVAAFVKAFELAVNKAVADLKADPSFQGEFANQLLAEIPQIANVVTDYNTDQYGNAHRTQPLLRNADGSLFTYEGTSATLCPKPDAFGSLEERATYHKGQELWWYNCNEPKYPYPTYHLDDTMTSAIAVGWMMADYDIVGNLYWNCTYYLDADGSYLDNVYGVAYKGSGANGDGTLMYPGKVYGVDGPVATLRLDAIRDGYEDYELIRMLKDGYAALGKDSTDILDKITESIYDEASIVGDAAEYETARRILLQAVGALKGSAQMTIDAIEKEETSIGESYSFRISAAEGAKVYSDGAELTREAGGYLVKKALSESKNYLNLTVEKDGKEFALQIYLGGKQLSWQPDTYTEANVTGEFAERKLENDYYKLTTAGSGDKWQVALKHDSLQQINEKTAHYLLNVYAEAGTKYTVYINYSGYGKVAAASGTFEAGVNQIDLDIFSTVNWKRNKSVVEISIVLEDGTWIGLGEMKLYEV